LFGPSLFGDNIEGLLKIHTFHIFYQENKGINALDWVHQPIDRFGIFLSRTHPIETSTKKIEQ